MKQIAKKIKIESIQGGQLIGILEVPEELKSDSRFHKPLIILSHGFAANKDIKSFQYLSKSLVEQGFSVFRFDFPGHGESTGRIEETTVTGGVENLECIIKYFKEVGFSNFGLIGSSYGGMVSLIVSSRVSEIYTLILKSSVFDYKEVTSLRNTETDLERWRENGWKYRKNYLNEEMKLNYTFYEDIITYDGYKLISTLKIPVLIIHGVNDSIVPISQAQMAKEELPSAKLEIINTGHDFSTISAKEEAQACILKFLN